MNTINKDAKFYQMLSRNNDVNGNPYRLIVVYNSQGTPVQAFEARSSTPNIEHKLYGSGIQQLLTLHLQPSEYNRMKRSLNNWAQVVNGVEYSD